MHTRRLASFFLGAWILGLILMFFVVNATTRQSDHIMASPPGPVAKDIEDLGSEATQTLLRYHAAEVNRTFMDIWSIIEIGIGAAFLSTTVMTAHRSKLLVGAAGAMLLFAILQGWWLAPNIRQLGRTIDFLPETANSPQRESHTAFQTWYSILGFTNLLLGSVAAVRLMVDRYGWTDKAGKAAGDTHHHRRRRRRRTSSETGVTSDVPIEPAADDALDTQLDR